MKPGDPPNQLLPQTAAAFLVSRDITAGTRPPLLSLVFDLRAVWSLLEFRGGVDVYYNTILTVALGWAFLGNHDVGAATKHLTKSNAAREADPLVAAELGEAKWHLGPEFSPGGAWLLTAGTEDDAKGRYVVTKWDLRTRKVLAKFPIDTKVCLSSPAVAPSGRSFAVCDQKGAIFVCDSSTGKVLFSYEQTEGRGSFVRLLTFLDDDHVLSADAYSVGQKRNIRDNRTWIYRIGDVFGLPAPPSAGARIRWLT